jgi:hypothetical protein
MSDATLPNVVEQALDRVRPRGGAIGWIALLAGLAVARVLLQAFGFQQYGFFRDELYYIACSHHLAWGYIDQPPLIALVAWFARHVLGDSLIGYRILPALAGGATVFFTGLLARELGGGRLAQFVAGATILLAPLSLAFNSFLSMNAFEPLFWIVCAWLAVRIVKGESPKLWVLLGAVAGAGLENKHTMLVFIFAMIAGLALSSQVRSDRSHPFHSKWIWLGALAALVLFLPNLIWEARHGWPQIEVVRNAQQFKNADLSPLRFLAEQILFMQPLALPIWLGGLSWYLFATEGKRFRFLGWEYLIVVGIFIVLHGKSYYAAPIYPVVAAAGGVAFEQCTARTDWRWVRLIYPTALILCGLATLPFGVPLLPVETFIRYSREVPYARSVKTERDATVALPQIYADMFGWENMAGTIARVYHNLPQAEKPNCAILAGNYGEAGAIDFYGAKLGLPRAVSGHNNYFLWGPRDYSGECVILFGERAEINKNFFGEVERVATISDAHAMPSEQEVAVYLCRKPKAPLNVLWPRFKLII